MIWIKAPDIRIRVSHLVNQLQLKNIELDNLYFFRSTGSSSRAFARIWNLPKIWQLALNISPGYCIEVISEKFDTLKFNQQDKILIHELLHIPKSFSGSLVPHRNSRHRSFRHYHDKVEKLFNLLNYKK